MTPSTQYLNMSGLVQVLNVDSVIHIPETDDTLPKSI